MNTHFAICNDTREFLVIESGNGISWSNDLDRAKLFITPDSAMDFLVFFRPDCNVTIYELHKSTSGVTVITNRYTV